MDWKVHWEQVYKAKASHEMSWFQPDPATSLCLLEHAGLSTSTCLIDVGGGDSQLVDLLVDRGLTCLSVLDISGAALERAKQRLGPKHSIVNWIEANVASDDWTAPAADIWHDRAVFHFLTAPKDRGQYVQRLLHVLKPGGSAIIATFAPDGPTMCSGLPVTRYSSASLSTELGSAFELVEAIAERHHTPARAVQSFLYHRFRRIPASA